MRPRKLASASDNAARLLLWWAARWEGGGQIHTHHLRLFPLIRISEKQSRARGGHMGGGEERGRSKALHGCGRRGRISFETESLWGSRSSPGAAGLGCVSPDLGMCQLCPPLVAAGGAGGSSTLVLSAFGSGGGYLRWQQNLRLCFVMWGWKHKGTRPHRKQARRANTEITAHLFIRMKY